MAGEIVYASTNAASLAAPSAPDAADPDGPNDLTSAFAQGFPAALYIDQRTSPLVGRAQDYRASIIRFTTVGMDLPLHIMPMADSGNGALHPSISKYWVWASFTPADGGSDTVTAVQPVLWPGFTSVDPFVNDRTSILQRGPANNVLSSYLVPPVPIPTNWTYFQPAASVPVTDPEDPRLWVMDYQTLLDQINDAFGRVVTAASSGGLAGVCPPQIRVVAGSANPTLFEMIIHKSSLFKFTLDSSALQEQNPALTFGVSSNLWPLLEGFPVARVAPNWVQFRPPASLLTTGQNALSGRFNWDGFGDPWGGSWNTDPNDLFVMQQTMSSTDAWSPVGEIAFSSSLPIEAEVVADTYPLLPGAASTGVQPAATNASITVISDLDLDLSGGATDWRGKVTYNPSAQYRWLSFGSSNAPVSSISWRLLWRNRLTGSLSPVYLRPGGSVSMKLLFQRRY